MYPVLAQHAIQIEEMDRRQRLANAERARLARERGTLTDRPSPWERSLARAWTGLSGAVKGLVGNGGVRPVEVGGEGAAVRP